MAERDTTLAWIGLGAMGLPMLSRAVQAGFQARACDVRPERVALAVAAGADGAPDPAAAVGGATHICSMRYDDQAFAAVVAACAPALTSGQVWIDFSTLSPDVSARMAQRLQALGVDYLRAPVSGSVPVAQAGALSVFVSGPQAAFERCMPLLASLSSAQRHVGDGEHARVVKLAINLLLVGQTALLGEALALGEAGGVSRAELMACINGSIVGNRHTAARTEALVSRRYGDAGPLALGAKDLDLALGMARSGALGLPLVALVREVLTGFLADGHSAVEISKLAEHPHHAVQAARGHTHA